MLLKKIIIVLIVLFFNACVTIYASPNNFIDTIQPMNKALITPPYLKKGDTIAIVATAGIIKDSSPILKAKALAESWGLTVLIGKNTFNQANHFAGIDSERLSDFQDALNNTSVRAIWCARGGYGTVRIIDDIDFTAFKKNPKWIIGYSDITVLHSHIHNLGFETLHAILGTSMDFNELKNKPSIASFKKALFGEPLTYTVKESSYNKMGHVKGQLVGGNLAILQSLLGSTSSINTKNKILFIEEIGEYHYQIDRMLYALKRAGYFESCKGIIIGGMTKIRKNTTPWGQTIEELILAVTKEYTIPILFDFPAGHDIENNAMILGRTIDLYVTKEFSVVKFNE
jgi:muramoyltetrapeptide carboxypeptidase